MYARVAVQAPSFLLQMNVRCLFSLSVPLPRQDGLCSAWGIWRDMRLVHSFSPRPRSVSLVCVGPVGLWHCATLQLASCTAVMSPSHIPSHFALWEQTASDMPELLVSPLRFTAPCRTKACMCGQRVRVTAGDGYWVWEKGGKGITGEGSMPGLGNEAEHGPAHLTSATRTGKNGMLSLRRADAQC